MTELSHRVRASLLTKERLYRLGPQALCWTENGAEHQIAYSDLTQMRLISYASYGGLQGQCTLKDSAGGKVLLRSHHYESLGSFDDRSATYRPFVSELARRIAASNADARFIAGSRALWFAWLVVLMLIFLVLVLVVIGLLEKASLPIRLLGGLIPILIFAPITWNMVRRNKQKTFDPTDISDKLLGG